MKTKFKTIYLFTKDETKTLNINDLKDKIIDSYSSTDIQYKTISNVINNYKCLILGTLGLWNGTKNIIPVEKENLEEALKRILQYNYYDIHIFIDDSNELNLYCYHHDGINKFYFKFILPNKEKVSINSLIK